MNKTNYTINTIKFLSMLCVVGIHVIVYLKTNILIRFLIDSFYRTGVPLFFIITGYLIIPKITKANGFIYLKQYILKLTKIITICSLSEVVLLYFKYNLVLDKQIKLINVFKEVVNLKNLYYGYDIGFFVPLWYLIAIIYCLTIIYVFKKNVGHLLKVSFGLHILGLALKLVFNDLPIRDCLFFGLFYTTLGCYININEDAILSKLKNIKTIKMIFVLLLVVVITSFERMFIDLRLHIFLDFTLLNIISSIIIFLIALKNKEIGKVNYFCQLGQNTMGVLLFHSVILQFINLYCLHNNIVNPLANLWVNLISVFAIYLISHYLYCFIKITMNYIFKKSHTISVK